MTVTVAASEDPQSVDDQLVNIAQKYAHEREKRVRPEGIAQFIDLATVADKIKHYESDPWIDPQDPKLTENTDTVLPDGSRCKYLVIGAGFGGLLYAVRLLQAGLPLDDLRMIDAAGGFGGTWYWNRYPGLMCDVESYIYMPLLEETNYMPKHKYAYGPEMRNHAERIANTWGLRKNTVFRTEAKSMVWNDAENEWTVELSQKRPNDETVIFTVRAQFVFLTTGILSVPKIPIIPGIDKFQGHTFHASRWDYSYTGGSPEDQTLVNLKDKRVAIIGTGATSIQAVPALAKWVKQLYVVQRTATYVDSRGQVPTDPEWFTREVATKKGWQRERIDNFNANMSKVIPLPTRDLVDDQWTKNPTFHALLGRPGPLLAPEQIPAYVAATRAADLPHSARIRARVEKTVKDSATAEKLKPWYYTWCKRPLFHDEYLPAFNLPNVKLVDTDGKGIDRLTEKAVVIGGKEYETDLLIFGTGFNIAINSDPASHAGVAIKGRTQTIPEKWETGSTNTLHGCLSRGFPNLFLAGPAQGTAAVCWPYTLDTLGTQAAYIVSEATKKKGDVRFSIEPSQEAEEEWARQILMRATGWVIVQGCTPGYLNKEGENDRERTQEEWVKIGQKATWGHGIGDYVRVLEEWRAEGGLKGLEVKV